MSKELEEVKLPKIKKLDDDVFCFEDNEEMVFVPKSKYEENEKTLKALEIIKNHPHPILLMAVIEKYIMELNYSWEKYNEVFKDEPIKDREIKCKEEYELLKEVLNK